MCKIKIIALNCHRKSVRPCSIHASLRSTALHTTGINTLYFILYCVCLVFVLILRHSQLKTCFIAHFSNSSLRALLTGWRKERRIQWRSLFESTLSWSICYKQAVISGLEWGKLHRSFTFFWPLMDHWAKSWPQHSLHRRYNTPLQQNHCGSLTGSFPTLRSKHCIWVHC